MAEEDDEFAAYATFSKSEVDDQYENIARVYPSLKQLKAVLDGKEAPQDSHEVGSQEPTEELSEVGQGVWHFYKQLKSYYELALVSEAIPYAFVSGFFRSQIVNHAEHNFKKICTHKKYKIFGLSQVDLIYINRNMGRWNEVAAGFDKLPRSILLSLVASFDSSFADFAKSLLKARPQRYSGSDRQYSVGGS